MNTEFRELYCQWKEDEDGIWVTDCKHLFECSAGKPSENDFNYCIYCGRKISEVTLQ